MLRHVDPAGNKDQDMYTAPGHRDTWALAIVLESEAATNCSDSLQDFSWETAVPLV